MAKHPSLIQKYQIIVREWMPHLSTNEFAVLIQLVDRTIGWGKTRATFSLNRVLEGDKAYGGIKMSRRGLFYALSSLEEKGMIARHKHPQGKQIRMYSVNMGWTPAMPIVPKRLQYGPKTSAGDAPDQCNSCTGPVHEVHTRERSLGEGSQENEEQVAARPADDTATAVNPDDLIRKAKADLRTLRRQPPRKLTTLPQKIDAAQREWRAAIEENHPTGGCLAWNQREVAMVKAKLRGWNDRRIEFHKFIGWCAANWSLVRRKQLAWMTKSKPPKTPEIGFLVSFITHFHEAWADRDLGNWMHEDQTRDYDKLRAKGLSHDEAVHRLAKDDAIAETRDENRKAKQDIAIRRGMLKRQEERLKNKTSAAPHPRSEAARASKRPAAKPVKRLTGQELQDFEFDDTPLDPNWEPLN
ncbi:hypothetical protein GRI34_00280 [Erythrobacter aquimaris]|uniref:Bacteriophage lambda Replication protein O N-terminal domain-containing protein n=1 Tax=Qipengyuania aquimaris TaxID=255984 RepID=A0A6I4TFI4_9SPHN|nr:hypothetical protein [Qipengyuania aquimaris]MXO94852.1 hypothetical protein [Qipengyuania aquimaris]